MNDNDLNNEQMKLELFSISDSNNSSYCYDLNMKNQHTCTNDQNNSISSNITMNLYNNRANVYNGSQNRKGKSILEGFTQKKLPDEKCIIPVLLESNKYTSICWSPLKYQCEYKNK